MSPFGSFLADRLLSLGMSRTAFAKEARTSQGFISSVIQGRRTPPLERIPAWAVTLRLGPEAASIFVELAAIAHLPAKVQLTFSDLMDQRRAALQRLGELEAIVQQIDQRRVADRPDKEYR